MDANISLRWVKCVHKQYDPDGNIIGTTNIERQDKHKLACDYYLSLDEVNKYKDEVKKRLPKENAMVSNSIPFVGRILLTLHIPCLHPCPLPPPVSFASSHV